MIDYTKELNPEQLQAVEYCDGPSLVIAGAGSGKTRVLTYKIAYLLEHGYKPWSILALTFTNKAANEMKQRIAQEVGANMAKHLWMGTFHSIFARILRVESEYIGFKSNFTIYDSSDSRSLIKSIIKELKLDDKKYKPNMIQGLISRAKNALVTPAAYSSDPEILKELMKQNVDQIPLIYSTYWNRCRQAGAMDFDDLLLYTYILFKQHEDVRAKYENAFEYILVDEYQDTNYAQHCIIKQLSGNRNHVCVVGDDAQSIYSFRGAEIDNILRFTTEFKGAKLFKLEQNYRSTQMIVNAANSLIDKNRMQIRKKVFSKNDTGEPLELTKAYSDKEEGDIVVNRIADMHRRQDYEYNTFAILYRTNAQSRIFEEALRKKNIPYRIYGGLSFYQRKEIKDVMAYFRLAVNPMDEEAFKRVLNYPLRGIGDTTLAKVVAAANVNNISLWDVLGNPIEYGCKFNSSTLSKLEGFHSMISSFIEMSDTTDAAALGKKIMEDSGILKDVYKDNSPEDLSRQQNLDELYNGMTDFVQTRQEEGNEFVSMNDFLQEVSLLTDQDSDKDANTPKVTLLTVHSAKGLEFGNVFVVGMEDGLFPSAMCEYSPRALEEERRLFYVAITRAKEHCFLSFANLRYMYGKQSFCNPSPFLKDIDRNYLRTDDSNKNIDIIKPEASFKPHFTSLRSVALEQKQQTNTPIQKPSHQNRQTTLTVKPVDDNAASYGGLEVGKHIEHERFGIGEINAIEGVGDNRKAKVTFKNVGEKTLLLRFARFKIID